MLGKECMYINRADPRASKSSCFVSKGVPLKATSAFLIYIVGGWPPIRKKCSSNWIISPGIGMNIKKIWNHHPVYIHSANQASDIKKLASLGKRGGQLTLPKTNSSHLARRQLILKKTQCFRCDLLVSGMVMENKSKEYPNSNDMMARSLEIRGVWVRHVNNSCNVDPRTRLGDKCWWFQPIWKILVKLDHFPR